MKLKLKLSHPLKAVDEHLAKKCEAVQFYIHISEENLLLVRRLLFDKDYFDNLYSPPSGRKKEKKIIITT